jgi:hypothetical protein
MCDKETSHKEVMRRVFSRYLNENDLPILTGN